MLLYELLTGTRRWTASGCKQVAILEMLRLIREEEPPRPSTRLSTTEALPSIAANARMEPKKLSGLMRGELDWIVMKALEKDRDRRYETANAFAADVQRYLDDEPVLAWPPSARLSGEEVRAAEPGAGAGREPGAAGVRGRSDRHFVWVIRAERACPSRAPGERDGPAPADADREGQ